MKATKLLIKTNTQKYPILIGSSLILKTSELIASNLIDFKKCLLVVDKKVPNKFINQIKKSLSDKNLYIYLINANEKNKSQRTTNSILKILLSKNFSREDCLIAIGGGITGDVSGFASSLFKRGLQFINIPTTLLAQVDSSVGGKTGINTSHGKNLIGSFYQPKLVISDTNFLKSLSKREIICGYAEILKHAIISDISFYNFLKKNFSNILKLKSPFIEKAIYRSCRIKKLVVEKDEKEKGLRKILNFGHTFAHAYEASLRYSKKLNHGEAVILGMQSAIKFSFKKKMLNINNYDLISKHINDTNLPNNLRKYFSLKDLNKIYYFMTKDKKNNSNKINLILLKKIGKPIINKKYIKKDIINFLKNELIN